jgi:peptide/nickel transport system permease protein
MAAVLRFVFRRVLLAIPILIGVTIVVFFTIKLIPGDPVSTLLGPTATPQARAELVSRLGLNESLPAQYGNWIWSVLHGDLGRSLSLQEPAATAVMKALGNTLILTISTLVVALIGGVALGTAIALRPASRVARFLKGSSIAAISIPQYSVALLLLLLAVETDFLPTGGMHSSAGAGFGDLLEHLLLPTIAASLAPMGIIARMHAVSLEEVMEREFVTSLRARGIGGAKLVRHAFHNSLPSLLTIAGLQVGYLLGGVLFVETIFNWPGLGQLIYQAISARDMSVIEAGVLVSATILVLVNVLVDSLHAVVDPRVRD